jgi:uncharacterized membrane protein YedE/YeeE
MMKFREANQRYWSPYVGGALLGVLLFFSFYITGQGVGTSGGINRVAVAIEDMVVPEHVDRTPYIAEMAGGDRNPLDHWIVWQIAGVMLGGLAAGFLHGRVRLETFHGPQITPRQRWLYAFVGGVLMGYGARLARGCASGQALSGGAVLAAGSWAFMLAVFVGGYVLAWFIRRQWQPAR